MAQIWQFTTNQKISKAHGILQLFDEALGALLPFPGRHAQPLRRLPAAKTWQRNRGILGKTWKTCGFMKKKTRV